MKILKTVAAAAAAACLAAVSMSSHAGLVMTIDDLSTAGVDWTSGVLPSGSVAFHGGTVGTWTLSNSTGVGNGWSSIFGIDLNSVSASSTAGGTLRITFTETDLNFGTGGPLTVDSSIGGTTQGTIAYSSWVDDSNAAFGHGQLLFSGSSAGGAFANGGSALAAASDPFSLTLQVDITHVGARLTSFDFGATVPEPGTLALLSLALLGAGVATRRAAKR